MMKICQNCGAKTNTKFCPECGTLIETGNTERVCPRCGATVKSNFCGDCGYNFTQANYNGGIVVNNQSQEQSGSKTSLILGIISCGCLFFGWSSIASIVLGIIGLKKAKEESPSGNNSAGYVLSIIGLIGGIIELIYCVFCLLFLGQMTAGFLNILGNAMSQY